VIELNRSTDDLLQKVASAENELDPDLLREVIPDEAEFINSSTLLQAEDCGTTLRSN